MYSQTLARHSDKSGGKGIKGESRELVVSEGVM